jgi:hypothetical protein
MPPIRPPPNKKNSKKPTATAPLTNCLTKGQWVHEVFPFVDSHPGLNFNSVVKYFATRWAEDGGPLPFHKSSLSQSLKNRSEIEAQVEAIPNGANLKRNSVTLCPEVDHALRLWFMSMQLRKEVICGDMIVEKRHQIEDILDIPDNKRPKSDGWLAGWKLR